MMVFQGAEFAVLPVLIARGTLCRTVDLMTIEFHHGLAPLPLLAPWQQTRPGRPADAYVRSNP